MDLEILIPIILFSIFIAVGLGLAIWAVVASQDALNQIQDRALKSELNTTEENLLEVSQNLQEIKTKKNLLFENLDVKRSIDNVVVAQTNIEFNFGGLGQSSCFIKAFEVTSGANTQALNIDFDYNLLPNSFVSFFAPLTVISLSTSRITGGILFEKENNRIVIFPQTIIDSSGSNANNSFFTTYGIPDNIIFFNLL